MFYFCHHFSLLCVETADRPGLLLEMMKIMSDINVNVESAEIETEVILFCYILTCYHMFFFYYWLRYQH